MTDRLEPIHITADQAEGPRIVWWAEWNDGRRERHYAVADSLTELRHLLPHRRRIQLVDQYGHPVQWLQFVWSSAAAGERKP